MKKTLFVWLALFSAAVQAQDTATKQISLKDYKTATISAFDDKTAITADVVNGHDGFTIIVPNTSSIKEVKLENKAFQFKKVTSAPHDKDMWYKIVEPFVDPSKQSVVLQLLNDVSKQESYVLVYLKVSGLGPTDITPAANQPSFTDLMKFVIDYQCKTPVAETDADGQSGCPTTTNEFFNEDIKTYDADKVVYVYDFDRRTSYETFYKITKVADKDHPKQFKLQKDLVNFNTEKLRPNQHVQIKIVNINKFLFDVTVNHSFARYDSQPTALFNEFFLGDSNILGNLTTLFNSNLTAAPATAESNGGGTTAGKAITKTPSYDDLPADQKALVDLLRNVRCFVREYNSFNDEVIKAFNNCSTFKCCRNFNYKDFANELLDIRLQMASIQGQLTQAQAALAKTTADKKTCDDATTQLKAAQKSQSDIAAKDQSKLSPADQQSKKDLPSQISTLTAQQCDAQKAKDLQTTLATQTATVQNMTAIAAILAKLPTEADIKKLAIFLNNMVKSNTEEVIPIENLDGDRLDVEINIKARDSLVKHQLILDYQQSIPFHVAIILKPRITFSSGTFLAVSNNLKNKTYDWQQTSRNKLVNDSSTYILAESGYSAPVLGFSALGNIEWRFSSGFGAGLSTGVGITVEHSPRVNYLAGPSLFFGEERQFVLTGGITAMQTDVLNNNLLTAEQQGIQYTPSSRPAINYYKEMKTGIFFSITFTPFTTSKTSTTTSTSASASVPAKSTSTTSKTGAPTTTTTTTTTIK